MITVVWPLSLARKPPLIGEDVRTSLRPADEAGVAEAAALLQAGRLVAFPTETVYGLGADARSGPAMARLYAAKDRPRFNPLIVHFPTVEGAFGQGVFDAVARALAATFWPGPLTLVVPVHHDSIVCDLVRAGLPSVAVRVPAHPVARAMLAAAGVPVAAPSANRSGRISPTTAAHVMGDLNGRCDLVLDGGPSAGGLESTIVACLGGPPRLLRPGGVSREAIEALLGRALGGREHATLIAPGMMASHYAPHSEVRLDATNPGPDEAVLDFAGQLKGWSRSEYLDLSPAGKLDEAAANLFGHLHRLDASGADKIAVAPIPTFGLGEAINDRLTRAAAPRP